MYLHVWFWPASNTSGAYQGGLWGLCLSPAELTTVLKHLQEGRRKKSEMVGRTKGQERKGCSFVFDAHIDAIH